MKAVFIDSMPTSLVDEGRPWPMRGNSVLNKLVTWMGVTEDAFHQNFLSMYVEPMYDPEGFYPKDKVVRVLNTIRLLEGRKIVLLGRATAEAFLMPRGTYEYGIWMDHPSLDIHASFIVIPHPTGRMEYSNPDRQVMVTSLLNGLWNERDQEDGI